MTTPTAGWYPDPEGRPTEVYWSGTAWTGDTRPVAQPSVPLNMPSPTGAPLPPPLGSVPPPGRRWYRKKLFLIPAAVVATLLVLGGIGAATSPANKAAGSSQSAQLPAQRTIPTHTQAPPPSVAPGQDGFTMPNEVGQVLQDAQDDLQRVSGDPLYFSDSDDASGQGRMQILDRDWQVCSQNVPPGTTVTDTTVTFSVVKLLESCP